VKKLLFMVIFILVSSLCAFGLQIGVVFNGDLQEGENTYVGLTARTIQGLFGLEISAMPKLGPTFDLTSYKFIVSPSIGWGTPELRIFGAIAPHLEINEGNIDFNLTQWSFGVGSTFMFLQDIIGFFEFFVEFDFVNQDSEKLSSGTMLNVGVTYNLDFIF